jgi:hypothetical protein
MHSQCVKKGSKNITQFFNDFLLLSGNKLKKKDFFVISKNNIFYPTSFSFVQLFRFEPRKIFRFKLTHAQRCQFAVAHKGRI